MKKLYNYIAITFAAALFTACNSDLDKAYYNDNRAKAAVLKTLPESYVIDNLKLNETALTFKWAAPEVGYNASITNSLEMDVKGENNFASNKITLSSSKEKKTEFSLSNKELNDMVLSLLANYAGEEGMIRIEPTTLQFRMVSSISEQKSPLISNVLSVEITPYDNGNAGYQAPQLQPLNITELTLDGSKKTETALSLSWLPAYMGDNASITFHVEIDKPQQPLQRGLLEKVEIASVKNVSEIQLTHQELNDAFIALQTKYGEVLTASEVEFKVSATINNYPVVQVSNAVSLLLTPYINSPELTLPEALDLTSDAVQTLSWQTVEGATYQIEMGLNEGDFSQKAVLCSGTNATEWEIDKESLNQQIKYLLLANKVSAVSETQDIAFRIKAYYNSPETSVTSTTKVSTITWNNTTEEPDHVYIVGAFSEWGWDRCEKLYSTNNDQIYRGLIVSNRLAEGWKITKNKSWNQNWGAPIKNGILTMNSGGNIESFGHNNNTCYQVEFNQNNGMLTMSAEEKSWMLVGNHNNNSFGDDAKMEIVFDEHASKWCMKKENVTMQAGNKWNICSQVLNQKITPEGIQGHYEKSTTHKDKFTVSETGIYDIIWYFNEAVPYLLVIKK